MATNTDAHGVAARLAEPPREDNFIVTQPGLVSGPSEGSHTMRPQPERLRPRSPIGNRPHRRQGDSDRDSQVS